MNWDQIQGNWQMMKGKAKMQWADLTDDDLARIDGRRDELVGKIQKVYGVSKEEAEAQVDRFTHTIQ